jgi:hypothetical protein
MKKEAAVAIVAPRRQRRKGGPTPGHDELIADMVRKIQAALRPIVATSAGPFAPGSADGRRNRLRRRLFQLEAVMAEAIDVARDVRLALAVIEVRERGGATRPKA